MSNDDYISLADTVQDDDVATNGIFTYIKSALSDVPEYLQNAEFLNQDYYYRHSGTKTVSPLVKHFLDDKGKLSSDSAATIARLIINAYKDNWDKVYKALTIDYSPIENVDETLTETTDTTGKTTTSNSNTHSGTDNHSYGGSDTKTNKGTDTNTQSGTDTTKNTGTTENKNVNNNGTSTTTRDIYGYNSEVESNADKEKTVVNQTVTDTQTDNLTQTFEHGLSNKEDIDTTETTTYNNTDDETINITDSGSGNEDTSGNEKHDLHRHGNIGVTTNQYMITEELKLRRNIFANELFADIDSYMTLPLY